MQKLRECAQEVLNLYNYFNGAIIFDKDAIAVYYYNNRPDINNLVEDDVVGKHLSQIYPHLDLEKSTIIEALTKGIPTANMNQEITNFKGQVVNEINTTIPIIEGEEIIGAVEVSKYVEKGHRFSNISVTPLITEKQRHLYSLENIVSCSPQMNEVKEKIRKVSKTDSPILIYGKTGTGKQMVAEAIHDAGKRKKYKFLSQNCAAIPATLLESILFGTVKGSFTGAENRVGLLESADGGTVFLDEINSLDMSLQAKILKAIEEQRITRVGDYNSKSIDVRIIAATNRNPWEMVQNLELREDLYYRLRVIQINLPDLRDRANDLQNLIDFFIRKFNKKMGKAIMGIDRDVKEFFYEYSWPGNVRELGNTIEGAFNLTDGPLIRMKDISWLENSNNIEEDFYGLVFDGSVPLKDLVREFERKEIITAMEEQKDMQGVLEVLGTTRQNLNHKLKQYNIDNYFDTNK